VRQTVAVASGMTFSEYRAAYPEMGESTPKLAAEPPAPLSLPIRGYCAQNTEPDKYPQCPRISGLYLVNWATGQVVPARCGANFCAYCIARNARNVAKAISLAAPTRAILLTDAPEAWQARRDAVRVLLQRLRRSGLSIEMVWHCEPNPKGTGVHIHGWGHGDRVPMEPFREAAVSAGFGSWVGLSKMRQRVGRENAVGYGLKGVKYGMKHAEAKEYLQVNGGRLCHATRGFWRDGPERLTLGTAIERTRAQGKDQEWQLVTEKYLDALATRTTEAGPGSA